MRKNGLFNGTHAMPLKEVAERLGWSENMVYRAWISGVEKLSKNPDNFVLLLALIKNTQRPLIGAASVECNRRWIELHGESGD